MPLAAWLVALTGPVDVELFLFIVGLALLLIIMAADIIVYRPFDFLARNVPVIGGFLSSALEATIGQLVGWGYSAASSMVGGFVDTLGGLANVAVGAVGTFVASIEWVLGRLLWLAQTLAAQALAAAVNGAMLAAELIKIAGQLVGLGEQVAANTVAIVESIPADIAAAERAAEAAAVQLVDGAERAAESLVANAVAYVEGELGQAIDGAEKVVLGEVDALLRPLEADIGQAIDGLGQLVDELGGESILANVAAWTAAAVAIAEIPAECVINSCFAVGPYQNMLNALQSTAMLVGLGAIVGECVRDPEGMAHEVAAAAGVLESIGRTLAEPFGVGSL